MIIWFLAGCLIMLIVSFTIYGKVQSRYDQDSKNKQARANKRILSLLILLLIGVYLFLFDHFTFKNIEGARWLGISLSNFLLLTLLSLFDAVVIDLGILVYWRPKFLHMQKDHPTLEYMKRHLRTQFTIGMLPLLILSGVVAAVFVAMAK